MEKFKPRHYGLKIEAQRLMPGHWILIHPGPVTFKSLEDMVGRMWKVSPHRKIGTNRRPGCKGMTTEELVASNMNWELFLPHSSMQDMRFEFRCLDEYEIASGSIPRALIQYPNASQHFKSVDLLHFPYLSDGKHLFGSLRREMEPTPPSTKETPTANRFGIDWEDHCSKLIKELDEARKEGCGKQVRIDTLGRELEVNVKDKISALEEALKKAEENLLNVANSRDDYYDKLCSEYHKTAKLEEEAYTLSQQLSESIKASKNNAVCRDKYYEQFVAEKGKAVDANNARLRAEQKVQDLEKELPITKDDLKTAMDTIRNDGKSIAKLVQDRDHYWKQHKIVYTDLKATKEQLEKAPKFDQNWIFEVEKERQRANTWEQVAKQLASKLDPNIRMFDMQYRVQNFALIQAALSAEQERQAEDAPVITAQADIAEEDFPF